MESSWKKQNQPKNEEKDQKEMFHVIHKVPSGDGPYVRAKHAQVQFAPYLFILVSVHLSTYISKLARTFSSLLRD